MKPAKVKADRSFNTQTEVLRASFKNFNRRQFLRTALQTGAIRGAALDVFATEPLPPEHPFWGMRQVFLSPHTADRVEGFLGPAFDCFLDNLARFLKGSPLINVVDKRAGY